MTTDPSPKAEDKVKDMESDAVRDLPPTMSAALRARRNDTRIALVADDKEWSWSEVVDRAVAWGEAMDAARAEGPFHVGILMENLPEYVFALCGAALRGATIVGLNPTRPPTGLVRDAELTDCSLVIVDEAFESLVDRTKIDVPVVTLRELEPPPKVDHHLDEDLVDPDALFTLIFTSGTSGDPKAVRCTQGTLVRRADRIIRLTSLNADDIAYLSMPLFHSNAIVAAFAPWMVVGARLVLRRRFSASSFINDIRHHGATYANYVGKPLSYVLNQPEQSDDAMTPLRVVLGNEASDRDIAEFGRRFRCEVLDFYGSSEGGVSLARTPDTPAGSLGRSADEIRILDPVTGHECERATFDRGRLTNASEAIGEMVNVSGKGTFEGYYGDEAADGERVRGGWFWTGDLAYMDAAGFVYFAGRGGDRIRVDGENMALGPIERVLGRHPGVVTVAAYAVPDPAAGDQLMVSMEMRPGFEFDPIDHACWIDAQEDLGVKARPRFIRIVTELPLNASNKVLKRDLVAEGWWGSSTWWRPPGQASYEAVEDKVLSALADMFAQHGRSHLIQQLPTEDE